MALIGQAVSEKKIFENGGRRTDDGRTTEHGYTISSPCEPDGSGELKIRYTPANPSFSIWWVYFSWTYFPDVAVEMSVALANVLPWQWGGGGNTWGLLYITKTFPCNIQRFFSAIKIGNFFGKSLIFLIYLLKTQIVSTL